MIENENDESQRNQWKRSNRYYLLKQDEQRKKMESVMTWKIQVYNVCIPVGKKEDKLELTLKEYQVGNEVQVKSVYQVTGNNNSIRTVLRPAVIRNNNSIRAIPNSEETIKRFQGDNDVDWYYFVNSNNGEIPEGGISRKLIFS